MTDNLYWYSNAAVLGGRAHLGTWQLQLRMSSHARHLMLFPWVLNDTRRDHLHSNEKPLLHGLVVKRKGLISKKRDVRGCCIVASHSPFLLPTHTTRVLVLDVRRWC